MAAKFPFRLDRTAGLLGSVTLEPMGPVVAGELGSWTLTYTVGAYGIDEGGTIKVAHRFASDWEPPQFDRPGDSGYTTVRTSGPAKLAVRFDRKGHHRPWMKCIVIDVYDGSLRPGDTVTIVQGDRSSGSPGSRAQTFQESAHVFQVFVDPTNACQAQAAPNCPVVAVVAGDAVEVVITLPAQAMAGQATPVHARGQDRWGNPTALPAGVELRWEGTTAGEVRDGVLTTAGAGWGRVLATWNGVTTASNPLRVHEREPALKRYWGDLHAQTDATVGTGTEEEYFTFGRDVARLDFTSHQGNDFQMTDEDWQRLNEVVQRFHVDGKFVVFPGFEWSANSPAGGDRNVFYLEEGQPIVRSSAWQVASDEAADLGAHVPVGSLFDELRRRVDLSKVICGSHVGGRYADIGSGFDEELGPLVEVVSCWGVFEWLMHDAIDRGHLFAVMANSDGHKGRPGAEGPGAGEFGIAGGLTCVLAENLSRQAIFTALKQRRCYGTTGARMDLDFRVNGQWMGSVIRGDQGQRVEVEARVRGDSAVEQLQLYRGRELVAQQMAPEFGQLGDSRRVRVVWQGSRIRGRGRRVTWDGAIRVAGTRVIEATPYSFDSPSDGLVEVQPHAVRFASKTTGDRDGVDLLLEDARSGQLTFESQAGQWTIDLSQLGDELMTRSLGGIEMAVSVMRYPESVTTLELKLADQLPAPTQQGRTAYYVKAIQCDGQMAWSSPVFVER